MLHVAVALPGLPVTVTEAQDAGTAVLLGALPVSVNTTVPVGVAALAVAGLTELVTVAVNVTDWPVTGVDDEAAMVVVLPPWTMVWEYDTFEPP
jgi:hypothetical protein